jgi:hypothetical protein
MLNAGMDSPGCCAGCGRWAIGRCRSHLVAMFKA